MEYLGVIVAVLIVMLVALAVDVVCGVLFLRSFQKLLERVSPQNRAMQPGSVWLCFVPFFNFVWIFMIVVRTSKSVRAEYRSRNLLARRDFGLGLGITYAIFSVILAILASIGPALQNSGTYYYDYGSGYEYYDSGSSFGAVWWVIIAVWAVHLVLWITYWAKCVQLRKELETTQPAFAYMPAPQYPGYGAYGAQAAYAGGGYPGPYGGAAYGGAAAYGGSSAYAGPVTYQAPVWQQPRQLQQPSCPSCGDTVQAGAGFCRSCGSPTSAALVVPQSSAVAAATDSGSFGAGDGTGAALTCAFCGASRRPGAAFCAVCGRSAV